MIPYFSNRKLLIVFYIPLLQLKRSAPPAELEKIIAASEMNGTLHFELKFKNIDQSEFMEATVANLRYPQEVIAFYQDRIRWD